MLIRELQKEDYFKGYMDVLYPFIGTNGCRYENEIEFYEHLTNVFSKQDCKIFVIELNNKIIATATALIEHKLHHPCMGHIEDVAVLPEFQQNGYGKLIVEHALRYCEERRCYKIVLSCRNELEQFYKQNGFSMRGICMTKYNN